MRIILAVFVGVAAACGGSGDAPSAGGGSADAAKPVAIEVPFDVTAAKLFDDYKGNELAADKQYKGRRARVVGQLERVFRDPKGTTMVILQAENEFREVACVYDGNEDALAAIKPGSQIALVGTVAGVARGTPGLVRCDVSPLRDSDRPKPDMHCEQGGAEYKRKCRDHALDAIRSDKMTIVVEDDDHVDLIADGCDQLFTAPRTRGDMGEALAWLGIKSAMCVGGSLHVLETTKK